ncbi:MAG: hypothetical protein K6F82_06235 [Sphaerochaetaceae bacterium]|nr:hypothetical protein [Sphaerochaetaceae bacterium]
MNPFVKKTGFRKLKSGSKLTGCFILIALVTAPLIFALVFSESMMSGITEKYICLSDGHIQTKQDISAIPESAIYSADYVISGNILLYSSTETATLYVKGVDSSYFNEKRSKELTFDSVTDNQSNLIGIYISRATAEKLGVEAGDKVAMMVVSDSQARALRPVLSRVTGIFHTGYDSLDKNLAYIDFDYAQKLFSAENLSCEILLNSPYSDNPYSVFSYLESFEDTTVWTSKNTAVYENFVASRQMIMIILILVVCVAAFYTASVANQIVEEDMKSISISKLLGANDSQIRSSVFLSVYAVTVAGITAGLILGLILSLNMSPILSMLSRAGFESLSYYLLDFSVTVPYSSIFILLSVLLLISFVTVRMTLRKTKRITPVQLFTSL